MKKKRTVKYPPRLANRDVRIELHTKLPDEVKEGLRRIAKFENETMSWVIEQCIIDYFRLDLPKYKMNGHKK